MIELRYGSTIGGEKMGGSMRARFVALLLNHGDCGADLFRILALLIPAASLSSKCAFKPL
jgi:hypothetical protein